MASSVCVVVLCNANLRGIFSILRHLELGPFGDEECDDHSYTFQVKNEVKIFDKRNLLDLTTLLLDNLTVCHQQQQCLTVV
jgi:hypothetical protein